jgi:hypothetical protein
MGQVATAYSQSPYGRVFDAYGSEQARIQLPFSIPVEGSIHLGEQQATELYAWRALQGVRDTLYRLRDDSTEYETITARLVRFDAPRSHVNPDLLDLRFEFDALEEVWSGLDHTETITIDASPKTQDVDNDGNTIQRDVVVTVTATVNPITSIKIENLETGHVSSFTWADATGVLSGNSLVIDCAEGTVRNNGVDAYASFTLDAGHTIADWLRLMPGANTIKVTMVGGSATSTCVLTYKDAWA